MHIDFPFHFDGRGRTADDRRRRPRARHDRAGAVHQPRRAREPARLRQRAACSWCSRRTAPSWPRRCSSRCQAALQRWLGDVIEVRDARGDEPSDATLTRRPAPTRCARTGEPRTRHLREGDAHDPRATTLRLPAATTRRQNALRQPELNGIDYLEVAADQRSLCVHFLGAVPDGRHRRQRAHRRRPAHPRHRGRATSGIDRAARSGAGRLPAHHARQAGRLLDLPLVPGRVQPATRRPLHRRASPTAADSIRATPASTSRFKVELPERPRLPAGARVPAGDVPDAGDQLPRQGLRELPPADARPPRADHARLARAPRARPRHHAGRAAGLRRRPPELLPGRGRDRGLPRHRAAAHLGAPPRAAGRLPHARGLQRARLGDRQDQDRPPAAAATGLLFHHRLRRRPGGERAHRPRGRSRAGAAGALRGVRAARARSPTRRCVFRAAHNEIRFYTWGDASAACRRARRAPRCSTRPSVAEPPDDPPPPPSIRLQPPVDKRRF